MNYETATVQQLHSALLNGSATPMSLLKESRRVIREKDTKINAFVEVFDSADEDARIASEMIASGSATPLTGIPIAIKDNICVKDHTATAGSLILKGFVSPYDATAVARLRAKGAIIVGRTNMDEFGMGSSTEHSVYGVTCNPHDTSRVAGGSSGGSAAAVSMGAVPLALGSDTGGSIRQPASFCGVVGLKPTYGSVSRHGLIALGSSLDVIGSLARTVSDAQLLFDAIAGADGYDNTCDTYVASPSSVSKVIGVPDSLDRIAIAPETLAAFKHGLTILEKKGYTIRPVSIPLLEHAGPIYYIVQPAEASSNLARFDGVRYGLHVSGETVWEEYYKTRSAGFGNEATRRIIVGTYVLSAGYYDAYYRKAIAARDVMRSSFLSVLSDVSMIALPTTPDIAFPIDGITDPVAMYAEDRLTLQANLTGLPALSVPLPGDGLPRGFQCIGSYNSEHELCLCASALLGE